MKTPFLRLPFFFLIKVKNRPVIYACWQSSFPDPDFLFQFILKNNLSFRNASSTPIGPWECKPHNILVIPPKARQPSPSAFTTLNQSHVRPIYRVFDRSLVLSSLVSPSPLTDISTSPLVRFSDLVFRRSF